MGKPLTTEQFIERAKKVHESKYNYSKVKYMNTKTKIIITCPIHGDFEQTPKAHLKGRGCNKCGVLKCTQCAIKSTEQVIKEFIGIHSDKYDYSKVSYEKDNIKVKIVCKEHGEFLQTPSSHLQSNGCPTCGIKTMVEKRKYLFEYFLKEAIKAHKNLYTYDKESYTSFKKHTNIKCNTCGFVFKTTPQHHVLGKTGCPNCASSGFNRNRSGILYYLKIKVENNKILYKIGITNRTIKERYSASDLAKIEIIKQEEFKNGQDALNKETEIKRKFKKFQYKGPDILASGNTELFTKDILHQIDIDVVS